jgi:hypothetical protein
MTSIKENHICNNCTHKRKFGGGCNAFPDGIPNEILWSGKHSKPIKGQKNNYVFERIKN